MEDHQKDDVSPDEVPKAPAEGDCTTAAVPRAGIWKRFCHSCGNIAKGLEIAGCCLIPLMWTVPSCEVNHATCAVVTCLCLLSFILAVVADRFCIVLGAIGLFLLCQFSICA